MTAITKAKQKRRVTDAVGPTARDEESSTKHGEPSTVKPLIQTCEKKTRTDWTAKAPSPPSPLKKRKRDASRLDKNEFLPGPPPEEGVALGSLDFHELLDEDALRRKSTVVNRAPVMMAWACVVAECLGFSREEALSIGMPSPIVDINFPTQLFFPLYSVGVHRNERDQQGRLNRPLRQKA